MLAAGGRAPPFGDLAKCATAANSDGRYSPNALSVCSVSLVQTSPISKARSTVSPRKYLDRFSGRPSSREMLSGCRNLHPIMPSIFPDRTNGTHRMRIVEQAHRDAGYVRVFSSAHINCRATPRAKILIKSPACGSHSRKSLCLAVNFYLIVRIICSLAKR
jgi:hypothetical protein